MGLDRNPLTATEHRKRWPTAVLKIWNWMGGLNEVEQRIGNYRPGFLPEHVFDFHDGLRFIVSSDQYNMGLYIHISASAEPGSKLWDLGRRGKLGVHRFTEIVKERIRFVGGIEATSAFVTPNGVWHLFCPALPLDAAIQGLIADD